MNRRTEHSGGVSRHVRIQVILPDLSCAALAFHIQGVGEVMCKSFCSLGSHVLPTASIPALLAFRNAPETVTRRGLWRSLMVLVWAF